MIVLLFFLVHGLTYAAEQKKPEGTPPVKINLSPELIYLKSPYAGIDRELTVNQIAFTDEEITAVAAYCKVSEEVFFEMDLE